MQQEPDGKHPSTGAWERIRSSAVDEFLSKGFAGASLRAIAATARVTTGAIYGYVPSKEALFDAIVAPAANDLYERYLSSQEHFYDLPQEKQTFESMREYEYEFTHALLDHVYDNRDVFVLVLACSAGTSWEGYLDRFIDIEVESTFTYTKVMRARGHAVKDIEPEVAKILASMFFHGFFEPFLSGMTREQAHVFIDEYEEFFHGGYEAIMIDRS